MNRKEYAQTGTQVCFRGLRLRYFQMFDHSKCDVVKNQDMGLERYSKTSLKFGGVISKRTYLFVE